METPSAPKAGLHPILWIAAIAVILLSAVGIAAMTGLLPSKSHEETPPPVVEAPPPMPEPVAVAPAPESPKPVVAEKAPAPKPKPKVSTVTSKPKTTPENNTTTYSSKPAPPPPCPNCAVVSSITPLAVEGEGSGLGAIAGGILGGVLGNQIGKGSGKDVARIAGIAGGAYAGHQVEKSQRAHTAYEITVRFEQDGSTQRFREETQPIWQVGDKVLVEGGKLSPR